MKIKMIIALVLVLFAAASLLYTFTSDSDSRASESALQAENTDQIYAFYLHGNKRCQTCNTIETYSHEAILAKFGDNTESGELIWKTLNFEEPENEHYITEFELYAHSLVLVEFEGEQIKRYKNLEKVWELVGDQEAFYQYVQNETESFLEGI